MICLKGPQLEDGYTRIANEILEVVSKAKFNGTQFKILMVMWRYTYGFNRKDSEFSLNFLSEATNCNKQQVKRELDKLIDSNVIIVVKEADFNSSRRLSFNKRYTEWKIDGIELIKKDTVSELAYSRVSEKAYATVSELAYQERQYKDNIKKDTITTIEDGQSETGSNNSVARAGADPAKQINPVEKIERYYLTKIRKRTICNGKDLADIVDAYEKYRDVDFIIEVMKTASEENKARNGRLTINSFSYFMPIFNEEWERKQIKKEVVKNGPTPGNSKQGVKFDKSKFLFKG